MGATLSCSCENKMSLSPGDMLPYSFLARTNCHMYFDTVYVAAHKLQKDS
jgi:hypothetical protein